MRTRAKNSQPFATGQVELFDEDYFSMLRHLVNALGGAKVVGPKLYPEKALKKDPSAAERYLLDSINPNREHSLGEPRFFLLLRMARDRGIHLGMHWLSGEIGYAPPIPIEPDDERDDLRRRYMETVAEQRVIAARLEKLEGGRK